MHRQLIAGEIPFTDPRIRAVFEQWAQLVEKGYFSSTAATMGTQEALAAVVQKDNLLGAKPAMILSGPAFLGELSPERRAELGFFPFPVMDATQPPAEVVMSIGYMVPSAAPACATRLCSFADYLASAKGRDVLTKDVVGGGLYGPAFAVADPATLSDQVRQGMDLIAGTQTVTAPYYMSVSPAMWPVLQDMQRRILTGPGNAAGFDLDALLAKLEAAR